MDTKYLKNFEPHATDLEQLMAVRTDLKGLAANYIDLQLDVPDWISDKGTDVDNEIKAVVRAQRLASIKKKKALRSSLMSAAEQRDKLDKEIAAEEALL